MPHNQLFQPKQHYGLVYCAIPSRQGQSSLPINTSLPRGSSPLPALLKILFLARPRPWTAPANCSRHGVAHPQATKIKAASIAGVIASITGSSMHPCLSPNHHKTTRTACATQPQDAWSECLPREVWKVPRRPRKQTARRTCTTCQRNNLMSKGACACSAVAAT